VPCPWELLALLLSVLFDEWESSDASIEELLRTRILGARSV